MLEVLMISIFSLTFNSIVLYLLNRKKHTARNYRYITKLWTLYHLIASVLLIILSVSSLCSNRCLVSGLLCKVVIATITMTWHLPAGFLLCFAIERYCHVSSTFETFPRWRIQCFVAAYVVVTVMSIILFLLMSKCYTDACWERYGVQEVWGERREVWDERQLDCLFKYHCFVVLYLMFVPLVVTMVMCAKSMTTLRRQEEWRRRASKTCVLMMRINDNRKIARILVSMVMLFVVFLLPPKLYFILTTLTRRQIINVTTWCRVSVTLFASYTVFNPLLYAMLDAKLSREIMALVLSTLDINIKHGRFRRLDFIYWRISYIERTIA